MGRECAPTHAAPRPEEQNVSKEKTRPKTLWSQTQLELLLAALAQDLPDSEVVPILADLLSRDFTGTYLIDKAERELGLAAAIRLRGLLESD